MRKSVQKNLSLPSLSCSPLVRGYLSCKCPIYQSTLFGSAILFAGNGPKLSKKDGTEIVHIHDFVQELEKDSKWRIFARKIKEVRRGYAKKLNDKRKEYNRLRKTNQWGIAPESGFFRQKRHAKNLAGKSVEEAFTKFNQNQQYTVFPSGSGKIVISPKFKIVGKQYVEVLYDVSGNYFRLQKGIYRGGGPLMFRSEHEKFTDWAGNIIDTRGVKGERFHKLMEESHWNAIIK